MTRLPVKTLVRARAHDDLETVGVRAAPCGCAAVLRVNVHGRDSFANLWLYWLAFKTIMFLSHLAKDIAEALLGIVTSALVL